MKLKNMWKRFWTLDVHNHEGFTLVELIIVIAILAILSTGAIAGYSMYVKHANMTADKALVAEIENVMLLAYYSGTLTDGDYVVIKFGDEAGFANTNSENPLDKESTIYKAMADAYGDGWENSLSLKFSGWKNSKTSITNAALNSNFVDDNGNLNMELLSAVDNLTGQLSKTMKDLNWDNFDGFTTFLGKNGINLETDSQKAANSAVLYLAQNSMNKEKREEVAESLVAAIAPGYDDDGNVVVDLNGFFVENAKSNCTEFEAVAMVYAAMTGYCLQKGEDTYKEFIAMDLLNLDAEGNPTVRDEADVLDALEKGFAKFVTKDGEIDNAFYDYLDNGGLTNDINAYYGVIDGISENQSYLMENLDGSTNFYANQQSFLTAYWNLEIQSGEVAVIFCLSGDGQPQTIVAGLGE